MKQLKNSLFHKIQIPKNLDISPIVSYEQDLMTKIPISSNLIPFVSISFSINTLTMLTDPNPCIPLSEELSKGPFSILKTIEVLMNLIDALSQLSEIIPNNYHGSIRKSIIFKKDGQYKIVEFQQIFKHIEYVYYGYCTAPELLYSNMNIDVNKIDVWSIGWLAYELVYGKVLWDIDDQRNFMQLIMQNTFELPVINDFISDFIKKTLVFDSRQRINMSELKNHSLFTQKPLKSPEISPRTRAIGLGIDVLKEKQDILGSADYQLKHDGRTVDIYTFKTYYNSFNMINNEYKFIIEEQNSLTNTSSSGFDGNMVYKCFDPNKNQHFVIRIMEANLESDDMNEYISICMLEHYLSKKVWKNLLKNKGCWGQSYDNFEENSIYLIQCYNEYNYTLSDLLRKKEKINISLKLYIIKQIICLFLEYKASRMHKILAVFPYNIVIGVKNIELAYLADLYVTKSALKNYQHYIDPNRIIQYDMDNIWKRVVYSLGIIFLELLQNSNDEINPNLFKLIRRMVDIDQTERPNLNEILEEIPESSNETINFFNEIKNDKVFNHWNPVPLEKKAEIFDVLFDFEASINIYQEIVEKNDNINIYVQLSMNYLREFFYEKAMAASEKGLLKIKNMKKKPLESKYHLLSIKGISLISLSQIEKALEILESASKTAEKLKNKVILADSYKNLSLVYKANNKLKKSLEYNEKSLELIKKCKSTNRTKTFTIDYLMNISQTYLLLNDYSKALSYCNDAIIFCEAQFFTFHPLLRNCYASLGNINFLKGLFDQSANNFEYAININKKIVHENHESFIDLQYDWATICSKSDNFEIALQTFENVLVLFENTEKFHKSTKEKNEEFILIHNSIARMHYELGNNEKSIEFYLKALDLDIKSHPNLDNVRIIEEYFFLGNCYNNLNQFELALEKCSLALKIAERILNEDDEKIIEISIVLADISSNSRNYDQAIYNYEKSLKLLNKFKYSFPKSKFVEISAALGCAYTNLKKPQEAIRVLGSALIKYKQIYWKNYENPIFFALINTLGSIYSALNSFDKAIKIYEEGLDVVKKFYNEDQTYMIDLLNGLAMNWLNNENFEKAIVFFEELVKVKLINNERNINLADCFLHMAKIYKKLRNQNKSIEFSKKGLEIYLEFRPPDHPDIKKIEDNIINSH